MTTSLLTVYVRCPAVTIIAVCMTTNLLAECDGLLCVPGTEVMATRFWQRWSLAAAMTLTVCLVLLTPFDKVCQGHCPQECKHCKEDKDSHRRVRDLIIYNNSELVNLTWKIQNVKHQREQDALLREEFLQDVAQQQALREEIESLKDAMKMQVPEIARLRQRGWVLDCVTWERKWQVEALRILPQGFTIDNVLLTEETEPDHRRQETFQQIYETHDWPASDPSYSGLQASGPGAQLKNAQGIMAALHVVINQLKQNLGKSSLSLLDLPCGDFQWMHHFLKTRNDVEYTGADIVPELIQYHQRHFADLPRVHFVQWDIVKTPLNASYDLILCRDMLQHLYRGDAMLALDHVSRSGSSYLLATTFPGTKINSEDIDREALGSRKVSYNLQEAPFSLVPPICTSYDWNVEHIALWSLPLHQKQTIT